MTIMEMARCMLFEKKLPKKLWAEVANTSVYLLNRLPTKGLKEKPHLQFGMAANLQCSISESLVASVMCLFLRSKGTNWIKR